MNIFYLHSAPIQASQAHCDKHVVKMILETAQMLSTAHRILDGENCKRIDLLYRSTHVNHPSNVWIRSTSGNYLWAFQLLTALGHEYTHRYGKNHATITKLWDILNIPPANIKEDYQTPIPLCMPDEFKGSDPVDSYRKYYMSKQGKFKMIWTKREVPDWFKIERVDNALQ